MLYFEVIVIRASVCSQWLFGCSTSRLQHVPSKVCTLPPLHRFQSPLFISA
eukprot:m.57252 g.57252  ORF g.57252 m.57252 type:complete len:51 (+) comp13714_c0_seq3:475-627(+)